MRAGRLNERVTVQSKDAVRDEYAAEVTTWNDVATVWMSVEPLSGREFLVARQAQSEITTRFRCRYRPGITTTTTRLVWRGQPFAIIEVIDPGAQRSELEILAFAETVPTP
jgi:SPP1 family predicted phage head-tail adaptor